MSQLLLTWYGDDFTGSTDVLEALTVNGVPAVLFLAPPAPEDLARFPECRAAGVAGISRAQSPAWMDEHLPPVFAALAALGAPFVHYKTCSTFDSAPHVGSIGRAIELGRQTLGNRPVPLVVGAPALRRYVCFGNLFATVDGETFRIDRHPTMSRHPVTPMDEGDLRRHLARQTSLPLALVDLLALQSGRAALPPAAIVLLDTLDAATLREAGRLIWESRADAPSFLAGSSGIEYALLAWWAEQGLLPPKPVIPDAGAADRLLVVSGSCSPGTARQIGWAAANGFTPIAADPGALLAGEAESMRLFSAAMAVLAAGGSPVVYTAAGPGDVRPDTPGNALGERLGALANALARASGVRRILIAGGDTSGHAGRALSIQALTVVRPFAPGSPLCRIWSRDAAVDGREIMLKGGQVGGDTLFGDVRAGRPATP